MGLKGRGVDIPTVVAKHLELCLKDELLRDMLRRMACQLEKKVIESGGEGTAHRMRESLESGNHVLDQVAMLVVALFLEVVSVNVTMGVTTWEALTLTTFPGL